MGNGDVELPIYTTTQVPPGLVMVATLQRAVLTEARGTKRRKRLEDEEEGTFVPERYIPTI